MIRVAIDIQEHKSSSGLGAKLPIRVFLLEAKSGISRAVFAISEGGGSHRAGSPS